MPINLKHAEVLLQQLRVLSDDDIEKSGYPLHTRRYP